MRSEQSSGFHLPGSVNPIAFGGDLQTVCRHQLRVETGISLPAENMFHMATCLEYLDVNSEGKADEIRLVVRGEAPAQTVSSQRYTHDRFTWSWERWADMKADEMGTDLRRLRYTGAVVFERGDI